ncbi:hypothetical protein [Kitasatospora sp. SUK 42]|uniref:hypothetical protein n=1 Tax=Kitasatospora sp. SUK 42 TaxID=1588882 RepID=UPI0018CAC867|nr:hypothetical protein [Kitasatospora sp. SUK 42]MBV2153882.1 hypothetical protein [Kitasatospora sp. SUK 42]
MSDSARMPLSAAEALRLADRAGAAARRPRPVPGWYGPVVAAGFAAFGIATGQAVAAGQVWLIGILGGVWGALCGLIGLAGMRGGGVIQREAPSGMAVPVLLTVLSVLAAMLGTMALAWWAGGGPQWIAAAGGVVGGAVFWAANSALNRRIRRLRDGG